MKIYTKAVWQWRPDGSVVEVPEECESFEYEGPLALCGDLGSSDQMLANADPLGNGFRAKGKTPQQPDYIGAANAQSYGTIGASLANNIMSHPNVSTPLGSQTWTQNGATNINIPGLGNVSIPQFDQKVSLSPEQQKLYDNQTQLSGSLQNQAGQSLNQPRDMNSVQDVADKSYANMTARLDPQWNQRAQMQETQLRNQGLVPGGEAYDNAMRDFGNQRNDAYQQANTASLQMMPQTQQLAANLRDQPLNEMNALKTGTQVNMPQFQQSQYSGNAQGPNTMGAVQSGAQWQQNMYNQQMAQQNGTMNGLMGLGSAYMMMG